MKKLLRLLFITGLFILPFTPPSDVLASVPFEGWSLNGDEENLYDPGTEIGTDKAGDDYTVRLKAMYGEAPDVKYAVSIYGIKQDKVQEPGKVAALTFGPATGANYTNSYKSCGSANCIHKLTWKQIIQKANENPTVFQSCLQNGCTKSVDLYLSDALKEKSYQDMTGDGVSSLFYSIKNEYRQFNDYSNLNEFNAIDFYGGWPASRMRTTLNGEENCTSYTDMDTAGTDLLNGQEALIAGFPEELKEAIVAKAVRSDCSSNAFVDGNFPARYNITTYDKLWLFSSAELISNVNSESNRFIYPNESVNKNECYQRTSKFGITLNNYEKLVAYNEESSQGYGDWYTRTTRGEYDNIPRVVLVLSSEGLDDFSDSRENYINCGIAPGFCVGTVNDTSSSTEPTAVIYADRTMIFYEGMPDPLDKETRGGTVGDTFGYTGWLNDTYTSPEQVPWCDEVLNIENVIFDSIITPKNTAYWFYGTDISNFPSSGLDTQNVTCMKYMFAKTSLSGDVDLRSLNTKSVTEMNYMFYECDGIKSLNLSGWDVGNVENITHMFYNCDDLESINLTGWNISSITNLALTFGSQNVSEQNSALTTIYAGDWTSNPSIASASSVFGKCLLPGFDLSKNDGDMCKPVSKGGYFTDPV